MTRPQQEPGSVPHCDTASAIAPLNGQTLRLLTTVVLRARNAAPPLRLSKDGHRSARPQHDDQLPGIRRSGRRLHQRYLGARRRAGADLARQLRQGERNHPQRPRSGNGKSATAATSMINSRGCARRSNRRPARRCRITTARTT